jgi:phage terminase large subunit
VDLRSLDLEHVKFAEAIIERAMVDRVFFVEELLGVVDRYDNDGNLIEKGLEDWQREILQDLDAGETRVTIRSGNGVGKTALVSWLGLHFVLFRDDVKVVVTSPSFSQLNDGLIPEMRKWAAKLPEWLHDQLDFFAERITRKPETKNNFVSFRTARKDSPEALQGIHAKHVMLLVDEASGVHDTVFEAGQGTMSTLGAIVVLISNPTRVTGFFYKTHTRISGWLRKHVTCMQSTRVTKDFPNQIAESYGVTSQQYQVKVLGNFPEGNADSVVPRAWVEEAVGRDITPVGGIVVWGVDPGRGGDPSGFCAIKGNGIIDLDEVNFANTMQVTGWIKKKWDRCKDHEKPISIYVDVIGIGAGVADRLEEMGLPAIPVNVAELAAVQDRYVRLRAELWDASREWFETKDKFISTDIDAKIIEKFVDELSEPCYKDHSSGRTDVESKKDLKARSVPSPNLADAFIICLAEEGAVTNGVISDTSWKKPLKFQQLGVA